MENIDPARQRPPLDPAAAKRQWRERLVAERLRLPDRLARNEALQRVMRVWMVGRVDTVVGAALGAASGLLHPRADTKTD